MAMLIAWVLFFVSQVDLVTALRDSHAVADEKGRGCFFKCCSSKCSNQSHRLVGDLGGRVKFEDCKVKVNKPFKTDGGNTMCQETCQVTFSGETKPVPVLRKSGHGPQECAMERNKEIPGLC